MRLEHLNMWVFDMEDTLKFYRAAFPHWKERTRGQSEWYGHPRTWLHFGDDYNYLSFNDNASGEMRSHEGHEIGLSHLAFVVDNMDAVIDRLAAAGFKPAKAGADNKYRRNIYFDDPNGYEVEFVEYLSDIPAERNSDE